MSRTYRAKFQGPHDSVAWLADNIPNLTSKPDGEGGFWISGTALRLSNDRDKWREKLDAFARKANMLIALADPSLYAIQRAGAVEIVDGNRRDCVLLTEPLRIEVVVHPVILSAAGGGPIPRPITERAAELAAREPRFARAANILAEAGKDLVRLYMVMELIERAHGGCPKVHRRAEREAFFQRLQVFEAEWVALHRTARPFRHAEPHEDPGPTITSWQARASLQHALKLWLTREVPI